MYNDDLSSEHADVKKMLKIKSIRSLHLCLVTKLVDYPPAVFGNSTFSISTNITTT